MKSSVAAVYLDGSVVVSSAQLLHFNAKRFPHRIQVVHNDLMQNMRQSENTQPSTTLCSLEIIEVTPEKTRINTYSNLILDTYLGSVNNLPCAVWCLSLEFEVRVRLAERVLQRYKHIKSVR